MTSAGDLLRDAEVAMHQAKGAGRDRAIVYTDAMLEQSEHRFRLGRDLRRAIGRDELRVHYQPVVDMTTGQILGVEALVRWEHPTRGMVFPVEFIGVAEETGLIEPLGLWVLEQACRQLRAWEDNGAPPLHVAVNLSPRQLRSTTIVQEIADILERTGARSDRLFLEVTESALMDDPDVAAAQLTALHELGIRLAIDDFGTGYSSLASLRRFPVDVLKIDRSFVTNLEREPEALGIVTAIISLAQVLNLTTIAEGVETEEERAVLERLGADLGQGYLWSHPVDADGMAVWLTRSTVLAR